jgi:hypothetical protein
MPRAVISAAASLDASKGPGDPAGGVASDPFRGEFICSFLYTTIVLLRSLMCTGRTAHHGIGSPGAGPELPPEPAAAHPETRSEGP